MIKLRLVLLLLMGFHLSSVSQNLAKLLQSQTWYWTGSVNDTMPIKLSVEKPEQFYFIARFSTSYRLILNSPNNDKTDSIFYYATGENFLKLYYKTKDSLQDLSLYMTVSDDKKSILLQRGLSIKAVYPGRDTITCDYFWLTKGSHIRDIFRPDNIIVYSRTDESGKILERTRGDFYQVRGDSLFIDTDEILSYYYETTGRDTLPPHLKIVKLQNIAKLCHERKSLNYIMGWGIAVSVTSALLVSPLVSIQNHGINKDRYFKVAGTSLAATAAFITLRISLSHKKMIVGNGRNSWETWQ